jgi:hypothetical protein
MKDTEDIKELLGFDEKDIWGEAKPFVFMFAIGVLFLTAFAYFVVPHLLSGIKYMMYVL